MKKRNFILLILFVLINSNSAQSQLKQGDALDRVVAIVGNEIILQSDIRGQIALMSQQNPKLNPNDPELYQQLLDALINEKLLIAKAIEDSVEVSDDQIDARFQAFLQTLLHQYGSEERIERVYGKSINRLKFELRDDIRNKLLSANLIQNLIANVNVSPREVSEFFKQYSDSLPKVPEMVEVYHIVRYVKASTEQKQTAIDLARAVRDSLLRGGDFADFAKRYSQDESTANEGGNFGWIERGKVFPEFANAAFSLQINEISLPIETPIGIHLIQVLDKRRESVQTRHILFRITKSEDDREFVVKFLDSLRTEALANNNFSELAKLHTDDKENRPFGGLIGKSPINEFPGAIRSTLERMKDGDISEPIGFNIDPTKPAFHILYKKRTIPEHYANIEDDYEYIEMVALEKKKMTIYNDYIEKLRKEIYWELKK